jgi:hypothetical protein
METKYAVQLVNNGFTFFLRKTTWTSTPERASLFENEAAARMALDNAKQFMARKSDAKRCVIITMEG